LALVCINLTISIIRRYDREVENKKCLPKAYILPVYVLKIKGFLSKMEEREKNK